MAQNHVNGRTGNLRNKANFTARSIVAQGAEKSQQKSEKPVLSSDPVNHQTGSREGNDSCTTRHFCETKPIYGTEIGHYQMHSWVIMPNHVHLLLTPHVSVSKLLGSLKAATARRANVLLARSGQPFWQDESYDHVVRSGDEFGRIRRYIENNPVTACLIGRPEQYSWSSAGRPERPPQAEGLPHGLQDEPL